MRKGTEETRKKLLSVCVRLFLEQGYKQTSVSQIVEESGVARGSYQNLFRTKDAILLDLAKVMFDGQFAAARNVVGADAPPVYVYAVETSIQLALAELNENLREIYVEAYTQPTVLEYLHLQTAKELKQIFGPNFPAYSESDFYEMEIGSSGLMRNYMARKCDIHFPLERKLERFLELSLRAYRVPEEEQNMVVSFIADLDVKALANDVMQKLFSLLEGKFDFKLSSD